MFDPNSDNPRSRRQTGAESDPFLDLPQEPMTALAVDRSAVEPAPGFNVRNSG
jgi:hypothetical protein